MAVQYVTFALSILNFFSHRRNSKSIENLEYKLNFIDDDISWLSSNDSGKLVSEITKLKVKYESDLALLNKQILDNNSFNHDINYLVDNMASEFPEVFNFILANDIKLFELVNMTNSNLVQLYTISEELSLSIQSVISMISATAIKYGISLQDLSIKVDNNEKYIMVLSQKLLDIQHQLNQNFVGLKTELKFIQSEVDRQLNDIGLVSSNTTAVLLSDGSLKISDSLTRYTNRIFVGNVSNVIETGSSSSFDVVFNGELYRHVNTNKAALSFSSNPDGSTSWSCNKAIFSDTVKIRNIIPIANDPGVLLDLSVSRDVIIPDITIDRPIFVILRGGGLGEIDIPDIIPMFRPSVVRSAPLNSLITIRDENFGSYRMVRGNFSASESTVGVPGTVIIPVTNQTSDYKQFLHVEVQSKSDSLIILKVTKTSNWATVINSATERGGRLRGHALATLNDFNAWLDFIQDKSGTGSVFSPLQPYDISQGDLILRLPKSYLTFHGVEVVF